MPYLPPSVMLDRLSEFTSETLVGEIGEGSKFVRAQVSSMSSTLGFLSKEVANRDESIREQREALLQALDDLEGLGDGKTDEFVTDLRVSVESAEPTLGNTEAVEGALLDALGDIQEAIDDQTFGKDTPEARRILYELFETRVESQLSVLGRSR